MAGTFWYNATVLLSDPICFHTCLLVCSQLVSLFLYLHCDSSLWVLSVKGISLSPVPHFSLHCSVFFVLVVWGQDSSPICFRTRLSTSLSYVAVLSGCFRGTVCSLSSVCLRACPPCSLQLMPLLLSLSLAVLLSRCLFGHMILSGSSLALSCSLQRVSLIPSPLLLLGEEWISWPLVFLPAFFPLFRSHSLTLSLYHVLPYLPSYLSPTCLLILSPLPCFFPGLRHLGRRG